MAITTTTITKAAGYARTDVIYQLEQAFTWLGFQGGTISGIVTGISAYSGGGTVGGGGTYYHEVFPSTTSGIGTGASFYIYRNSTISQILVNRPGVGYTNGEYVTLSAADIGGSANGAVAIGLTVLVAGGGSPVGYGSTNTFFDKDVTAASTYPWGVVRHTIEPGKKFGDTYRAFQTTSATAFQLSQGSSFHPWDTDNTSNLGNVYGNRFAGNNDFDTTNSPVSNYSYVNSTTNTNYHQTQFNIANSTAYQLDLNIYRSALDPKFAVFAYKQPSLSSQKISDNNFDVFFFHNYTTSLWDLDYLFLGGYTRIVAQPSGPSVTPYIDFNTYLGSFGYYGYNYWTKQKRSAEWGYSMMYNNPIVTRYPSTRVDQNLSSNAVSIYSRTSENSTGGYNSFETLSSNIFYNPVIKGLPLSISMAPCPYYLPDDFVMIDFKINTPSVNVQQGDTITISGSEVYKVITASYNQTTTTRGIAFCGRSV